MPQILKNPTHDDKTCYRIINLTGKLLHLPE